MLTVALALLAVGQEPEIDCANAMADWQIASCINREVAAEEARLEEYLQAALDAARARDAVAAVDAVEGMILPQEAENLLATQAAWREYASLFCEGGEYQRSAGGTIQQVLQAECMRGVIHERTRSIWREHLAYPYDQVPEMTDPARAARARQR